MKGFVAVWNTIMASIALTRMFYKHDKRLFYMEVFLGVTRECQNVIVALIPGIILYSCMNYEWKQVLIIVGGIVAVYAFAGIAVGALKRYLSNYSQYATNTLYYDLNRKNARLNLEDVEDSRQIDLYYQVFDNCYNFSNVPYYIFCTIFSKTVSFLLMSFFIWAVDWRIYLIIIAMNAIELYVDAKRNAMRHRYEGEAAKITKRIKYLREIMYEFQTGREIRAYRADKNMIKKYRKESGEKHRIEKDRQTKEIFFSLFDEISNVVEYGVIYLVAVGKFAVGLVELANFVIYINAAKQISSSIAVIVNVIGKIHGSAVYYKDYRDYLKIPESIRMTGKQMMKADSKTAEFMGKQALGTRTENAKQLVKIPLIEFRNVSYRYRYQEMEAIKNLSFQIYEGETISIVGDNGAGKSTLIKLLLRLYDPTEGVILYKGTDIKKIDFDCYQELYGVVFQDYTMNAFTLRENLIYRHEKFASNIESALQKVGMRDKVIELGLDRPYTRKYYENGVEFSGGEEQKFAIARAYCKNTDVLILDEPTAAIDPLAEHKMFQDIFDVAAQQTSIFISHRMSSTKFSDRIFVLEHAELVESGSHEELLQKNGVYADMYQKQAQYYV